MAVYFVLNDDGVIKIGTTDFVRKRVLQLRGALLAVERGGYEEEKALHRRFAHLRLDGEWFLPSPDLLDYIVALRVDPTRWLERPDRPRAREINPLRSRTKKQKRPSKFALIDDQMGGRLAEILLEERAAGSSWRALAYRIFRQTDTAVSYETLRQWAERIARAKEGAA